MRPAFSSTKSAAAFALLLLVLLVLPVVVGKSLLPPREQAYAALSWGSGPYPWIRNQIFEDTNDIDIAFLGSSHMLNGIDTPYVQAKLSERLGRPAVVRTIAWGGAGYDGLYFVTQDLLQHRKVHLLVFYDEMGDELRNVAVTSEFRWGDQGAALAGLPVAEQAIYYFAGLVGLPRTLLDLIRPNIPAELIPGRPGYVQPQNSGFVEAPRYLGAAYAREGFSSNLANPEHASFTPYHPVIASESNACVYSSATKSNFEFSQALMPAWQVHFAKKFAALATNEGCQLMMLNIPTFEQRRSAIVSERAFWPDLLSANVVMLGLSPDKMFGGLPDEDVLKLFADPYHYNKNGQEYFTRLITPALLKIYEASANN